MSSYGKQIGEFLYSQDLSNSKTERCILQDIHRFLYSQDLSNSKTIYLSNSSADWFLYSQDLSNSKTILVTFRPFIGFCTLKI